LTHEKDKCQRANSSFAQVGVECLNEALCFVSSSVLAKVAVQCSANTFTHSLNIFNGIRDSLCLIMVNQTLVLCNYIWLKPPLALST
jgi:hypothetical protein